MQSLQHQALKRAGLTLSRTLRHHFGGVAIEFRHFDHHLTHAALAAYGSPFEDAACAVIDSYGESGSLAFFEYEKGRIRPLYQSKGPQSLGFFYMKLTELCGFDWMAGEEWKVMGLASYGKTDPELLERFRQLIRVEGFNLHQDRRTFFKDLRALERYRRPLRPWLTLHTPVSSFSWRPSTPSSRPSGSRASREIWLLEGAAPSTP
jgi:carbamoyltransferase